MSCYLLANNKIELKNVAYWNYEIVLCDRIVDRKACHSAWKVLMIDKEQ
jgi:hypothetical protein